MKLIGLFAFLFLCIPSTALSFESYSDFQSRMQILAASNGFVERFELVTTETGNSVTGLIVRGFDGNEEKINQLVVGTHHGDEYGSPIIAMAFAEDIIRDRMVGRDVYIIPILIPEAYQADTRLYRGVNPNRDYPGPCGCHDLSTCNHPFQLKATQALANLIEQNRITAAITVHNPWGTNHYPWSDNRNTYSEEHSIFTSILDQTYRTTKYRHGTVPDMFYEMRGNFIDYAFWQYGVWGFLIEVAGGKKPSPQTIISETAIHVPRFRQLLVMAPSTRSSNNGHPGCTFRFGPLIDAGE